MLRRTLKSKLVVGLVVLAAAAFAGGAYAATRDSASNARQSFLNDVAKRLHVTPAQLGSALTGALQDRLNAAVKAGRLTRAQASAIEQRMKANGGVPFFGGPWLQGPPPAPNGKLGPRSLRGFERPRPGGPGKIMAAAAKYLGLTRSQLLRQLRSGKSLAQIANARGKTTAGLEQAITAAVTARLDKAVAAKWITGAQEKQLLSRFSSHLSALINARPGVAPLGQRPIPGYPGPPIPWGRGGPPPGGLGNGPGPGAPGGPGTGPGPGGGSGRGYWGPYPGHRPHPGAYVPTPRAAGPIA